MNRITLFRLTFLTLLTLFMVGQEGHAQARKRSVLTKPNAVIAGPSMVAQVAPERYEGTGWTIRLEPALFFRTVGLQVEKSITEHLSLGVNVLYKVGTDEKRIVNGVSYQENYTKSGYLAEIAGKYYFEENTPSGLYVQAHVGTGNLLYEDGTWRPIGINTNFVKYDPTRRTTIPEPSMARYGVAGGYQMLILNRSLAVNVMAGLQCQNDIEGFKALFFFAPSVGIYF